MWSSDDAPRKLTHEQARAEQRAHWARMSPEERLAAAAETAKRGYELRGVRLDEQEAAFAPCRLHRRTR